MVPAVEFSWWRVVSRQGSRGWRRADGQVVFILREVPFCSMGFADYLGRPRGTAADWACHDLKTCWCRTERIDAAFPHVYVLHLRLDSFLPVIGDESVLHARCA